MIFHAEVLAAAQKNVLKRLGKFASQRDFYLAGGTALAIYLGHRRSKDFDLFTKGKIVDPIRLAGDIKAEGIPFITGQVEKGTLYGTISDARVCFLEYLYPLLQPCILWQDFHIPLASLSDLACMKLAAVAQRGSKKDFVDIFALGSKIFTLKDMLTLYQKKFSIRDIGHVMFALTYFDEADGEPTPKMFLDVDWKTMKKTIRAWVKENQRVALLL